MAKLYHALCWVLQRLLIQRESQSTPGRATITVNTLKCEERENNTPAWIIIIIRWVQSGGLGRLEDLSLFTTAAGALNLDSKTEELACYESTQASSKSQNNYNNKNNYSNNNNVGERVSLSQQACRLNRKLCVSCMVHSVTSTYKTRIINWTVWAK